MLACACICTCPFCCLLSFKLCSAHLPSTLWGLSPHRGPELSAYREIVQKAARSHQWEYVRNYDRQFRKAAAGDRARSWARVDSSLFMQELAGPQAAFLATGARNGGVLEGTGPRKRSRESGSGVDPGGSEGKRGPGTCHRFNGPEGICHYGNRCKFRHCCAKCGGPHPGARCGNTQSEWRGPHFGGPGAGQGSA